MNDHDLTNWRAQAAHTAWTKRTWFGRFVGLYGLGDSIYIHTRLDREPNRAVTVLADRQEFASWVAARIVGDAESGDAGLLAGDTVAQRTNRLRVLVKLGVPYGQALELAGIESTPLEVS